MYTYKDIITKKIRKTHGIFAGWTEPTGLLNVRYAHFRNPRGSVLVPVYLLTKETLDQLPPPATAQTANRCTCDLSDTPDAPADWHFETCPEYQPAPAGGEARP